MAFWQTKTTDLRTDIFSNLGLSSGAVAVLCGILVTIAFVLSLSLVEDAEKRSEYECGFEPFDGATRLPFDVHFYLVGILFLIFDVEVALLFPWIFSLDWSTWFSYYTGLVFILVLGLGFLYEWRRGALIWPYRRNELAYVAAACLIHKDTTACACWLNTYVTGCALLIIILASLVKPYAMTHSTEFKNTSFLWIFFAGKPCLFFMSNTVLAPIFWAHRLIDVIFDGGLRNLEMSIHEIFRKWLEPYFEDLMVAVWWEGKKFALLINVWCDAVNHVRYPFPPYSFDHLLVSMEFWFYWMLIAFFVVGLFNGRLMHRKVEFANILQPFFITEKQREELENRAPELRERVTEMQLQPFVHKANEDVIWIEPLRIYDIKAAKRYCFYLFTPLAGVDLGFFDTIVETTKTFSAQFYYVMPEIIMVFGVLGIVFIMALDHHLGTNRKLVVQNSLYLLGVFLVFTLAALCGPVRSGADFPIFGGYLFSNAYTTAFKTMIVLSVLGITLDIYLERDKHISVELAPVLGLATLFTFLFVSSAHLLSAVFALVGFSLNLYILVLFEAENPYGREAGVKYFYLSTVSSGFIIFGVYLFYDLFGVGQFQELGCLIENNINSAQSHIGTIRWALVFIVFGLLFKLSAFPCHLWVADVYRGCSNSILTFFVVPVKVAVLAFTVNLLGNVLACLWTIWQAMLMVSAGASLVWGCIGALGTARVRRFIAYTSVNQIGFLLIGLSLANLSGYTAVVYYLGIYATMTQLFMGGLTILWNGGLRARYLSEYSCLGHKNWRVALGLTFGLLSMAGIPPLIGFFGKYEVLICAQQNGAYGLVALGLLTSLISTYYYLDFIRLFWFKNPLDSRYYGVTERMKQPELEGASLFVSELALIYMSLAPDFLLEGASKAVKHLF